MATITRRELVDLVAELAGPGAAGQTLSDIDVDFIDGRIGALFDQLNDDEILTVSDFSAIPASWSPFLANLAANLCASNYGGQWNDAVKISQEAILRKLVRGKETREPVAVDYF
jgi:hypothetical protein